VRPIESYTIEFSLERATLSFVWRFKEIADDGTRLTQGISLEGENASEYLVGIQQAFTSGLATGMTRIATAIDRAYRTSRQGRREGRC
jgi:hypothetical protein